MLLAVGRGPKLVLAVALILTIVVVLHLSSFPYLSEGKLPTLPSTSNWKLPTTSDPPEQDNSAGDEVKEEQIEHEPLILDDTSWTSVALGESTPTSMPASTPAPADSPVRVGDGDVDSAGLPCQSLRGGEDVLVVMRTGATETKDKLPVHVDTTFQCFPNLAIFSDYGEDFRGYQIHDVFENIPNDIKNTKEQFKHYWHIQEAGRKGLDPTELSGAVSEETGDGTGKGDNPGWALDKWKFLPMINETLALYPDKKWYVFIEPDSYLVWSNFLQWLPQLDPTKSSYFGSEAMMGDTVFAHGGSVFLLTRPAMEKVANDFNNRTEELLDFTDRSWAGDAVLAKTLKDNGVPLTFTWPQFQGGNPAYTTDWEGEKNNKALWCAPALSYHHLIPAEVADLFQFEQGWIDDVQARLVERGLPLWHSDSQTLLHHRDTFKLYIQPNLTRERDNWDAVSDGPDPPTINTDISGCRATCEADSSCMQYTLGPSGCTKKTEGPRGPRMGQYKEGHTSGWLIERVQKWVEKMDHCSNLDWTTT